MQITKNHPIYVEFTVNTKGEVFNIKTNHLKKMTVDNTGYKVFGIWENKKWKKKYLHRFIAQTFIENPLNLKTVDHIDGDKTNNSITNLRWCTQRQNTRNREGVSWRKSKYKGLYWHKKNNKWVAQVNKEDGTAWCKYDINEEKAAELYNQMAKEIYGEFAKLNIITNLKKLT